MQQSIMHLVQMHQAFMRMVQPRQNWRPEHGSGGSTGKLPLQAWQCMLTCHAMPPCVTSLQLPTTVAHIWV